jgi:hypothetical protein
MNANQELSLKSRTAYQKSSCIRRPEPGTIKHIHSMYNESDGITLCDSLQIESSQSKLKASTVNNEHFHQIGSCIRHLGGFSGWQRWTAEQASYATVRMASVPVRVTFSLSTQACSGSEVPIILTTALHRAEWLKNLVKRWIGVWLKTSRCTKSFIIKTIKQFTSGTSHLLNGRLHVSVRTGPSSGLLMINSVMLRMLGSQLCLQLV